MDTITIRLLAPEAWADYKGLRLEALQREPQAFGSSYADASGKPDSYWRERLETAGDRMLFAVQDGIPVGMVAAYAQTETAGRAAIVSVYVTAEARGKGVARRLMEEILRRLANDPAVRVVSLTVNRDQKAAVGLYLSLGFTVTDEVVAMLGDGKTHDEYVMEKQLPARPPN